MHPRKLSTTPSILTSREGQKLVKICVQHNRNSFRLQASGKNYIPGLYDPKRARQRVIPSPGLVSKSVRVFPSSKRRVDVLTGALVGGTDSFYTDTFDDNEKRPPALSTADLLANLDLGKKKSSKPAADPLNNVSPTLTEVDKVVLNFDLGFTEKMLLLCEVFKKSPAKSATRLAEVVGVGTKIYSTWRWEKNRNIPVEKRTRGTVLRNGIAQLGPVFVKLAQTLSTRPDIIGEEAADALLILQDQMGPFDSVTAYNIIRQETAWKGPIVMPQEYVETEDPKLRPLFKSLSPEPIAAASIGQVYKGVLMDGRNVAVKVQRPGMVAKIALDMYICRQGLDWLEKSGYNGSEDLPTIVDEVGSAIFYELDYRCEAKNADDFKVSLEMLDYIKIPTMVWEYTKRRILVQEWINGRPMKALSIEEQRKMVQMGVTCSATQLLRTGLVHADPHEGNMMLTDDGKLALIDFGLVCRVDQSKQEAMASCILNILNANWEGVVDNLRAIEILPQQAAVWTDKEGKYIKFEAGTEGQWKLLNDEEFKHDFRQAMSGGQGGDQKRNFTQLVMDLTELAGMYKFGLPPYMVFIIRSITTLDFCAVRTNCNMYELAAPVAIWRALTPKTKAGILALDKALLTSTGEINWERLLELSDNGARGTIDEVTVTDDQVEGKEGINTMGNMLKDLFMTKEGAALRRVAFRASPKALLPPHTIRSMMMMQAKQSFKEHIVNFSPWKFLKMAAEVMQDQMRRSENQCDVIEDSQGKFSCERQMKNRRKRIINVLLRNKLAAPSGILTTIKIFGLMLWVAGSVIISHMLDNLLTGFGLTTFIKRCFSKPATQAVPKMA